MKLKNYNKVIKFTNIYNIPFEQPKPAKEFVPEWYRLTESYMGGSRNPAENGTTSSTIKKCVPVFDAITAGYIITLPTDIYISQKNGEPFYTWPSIETIEFHPFLQAPLHPAGNKFAYPKWINPWAIKTPKGYSCLFVQPFHRESPFTILPGIVDTDNYIANVNFPFVLNDATFEGMIPAGTPIAQVIPFKRNKWKKEFGTKEEQNKIYELQNLVKSRFFNFYRNTFWNRKEYK